MRLLRIFLRWEFLVLGKDLVDLDVFETLSETNDISSMDIKGDFLNVGDPFSYLKTQTVFGLDKFGEEYKRFIKKLIK